jgi:hypothetical protein
MPRLMPYRIPKEFAHSMPPKFETVKGLVQFWDSGWAVIPSPR